MTLFATMDPSFLILSVNVFPLQVRFARPESEQARQRRIQSYEFLQKKQAEEPWVHLHYHGVKVRSSGYRNHQFGGGARICSGHHQVCLI